MKKSIDFTFKPINEFLDRIEVKNSTLIIPENDSFVSNFYGSYLPELKDREFSMFEFSEDLLPIPEFSY
jgi:hypothetical protein